MGNVVLVVDMLRGFLEPGYNLYCGDDSRSIIPNVQRLLKREAQEGSTVLFVCDNHEHDDLEFQMFPKHCIKGTREAEIIPELSKFVLPDNVIPKNRYSGFFNTDLEDRLKRLRPERITICGVCTNICVLHTAAAARNRDLVVEVPKDCVATFDPQAHSWALDHMEKILGVKLVRDARS